MSNNKEFVKDYSDYGIVLLDGHENASGEIYCQCPVCTPFRKEEHRKEKKLCVKKHDGYWHCNHCGWKGHLLTADYAATSKFKYLERKKSNSIAQKAVEWFANRGISEKTLMQNRVSTERKSILQNKNPDPALIGKYVESVCIAFNVYVNNLLVNIKYRDIHKNFALVKGADKVFYGLDDISGSDFAIIVEGEIDKLSYWESGIKECVSVPNGARISEEERKHFEKYGQLIETNHQNLEYLDACIDSFKNKKVIYLATDQDAPGFKLREELARRLGKTRCKIVSFVDCNDPNAFLIKYGKEALALTMDKAQFYPDPDIIRPGDVWDKLSYEFDNGKVKGKSTGFESIDPHFTWRLGDTTALNGYPSEGKSTFAFNLILNSTWMHGWKWGIYSPENMPAERIIDTMAEILIGNTSDKEFKGRMSKKQYKSAVKDYLHKYIFIINNPKLWTPAELREKTLRLIERHGIVGIFKDPWKNMRHNLGNRSIDQYLAEELAEEVMMATSMKIINLISHHPPTPNRDKEKKYPAPSPFEMVGGQIWYATAYNIICIHRQDKNDISNTNTEFYSQKIKEHKLTGIPTYGTPVILNFDRRTNRFKCKDAGGNLVSPLDSVAKEMFNEQLELHFTGI